MSKEEDMAWMKGMKIYQVFLDRFAGHKEVFTEDELRKGFLYGNMKAALPSGRRAHLRYRRADR